MAIEEAQLIRATLTAPHPATPSGAVAAGPADGGGGPMSAQRSPEEIRRSIEANRADLGLAVEKLRGEVTKATDWRSQLRTHQREVIIGAAVAGSWSAAGSPRSPACSPGRRRSRVY